MQITNVFIVLLRSHENEVIAYRNAAVAATLWPRHLEMAPEQIGAILLLAGAGILQRSHATGAAAAVQIQAGCWDGCVDWRIIY